MADTLIVNANGPYETVGPLTIVDPTGQEVEVPEGKRVWLCRCGGSADKPFCDGTHNENGFQAENPARQRFKKTPEE
ncbi:MAG TPA: CDGSH iron-sulfur domain-containing protein [Candidatus Dormibacteraeota bacterium]|jgi:3-phenylpropionate/trans-cinnamate dioxygenase ferredoxin subunit